MVLTLPSIVRVREIKSSGRAIRRLVTLYGTVSQLVNEHYWRLPAPGPGTNSDSEENEYRENNEDGGGDEDGEGDADQRSVREEEKR